MASLRSLSLGLGLFLGPFIGEVITYYWRFEAVMGLFAILYLILGSIELGEIIRERYSKRKSMNEYRDHDEDSLAKKLID